MAPGFIPSCVTLVSNLLPMCEAASSIRARILNGYHDASRYLFQHSKRLVWCFCVLEVPCQQRMCYQNTTRPISMWRLAILSLAQSSLPSPARLSVTLRHRTIVGNLRRCSSRVLHLDLLLEADICSHRHAALHLLAELQVRHATGGESPKRRTTSC